MLTKRNQTLGSMKKIKTYLVSIKDRCHDGNMSMSPSPSSMGRRSLLLCHDPGNQMSKNKIVSKVKKLSNWVGQKLKSQLLFIFHIKQ